MSETPAAPFDLYDQAHRLLGLVRDGLKARSVTVPTRQYVTQGSQVVHDEAQLTVTPRMVAPGQPGAPGAVQHPSAVLQLGEFLVCLVRDDVPMSSDDGTPPSTGEMDNAGKGSARDLACLYDVLTNIRETGVFADRAIPQAILDVHQEGPQGGAVAIVGTYQVGLF